MNLNLHLIGAGVVCALAIRVLAIFGAAQISGSWWIAIPAIIVLDWIEGSGHNEVDQWRAPKI